MSEMKADAKAIFLKALDCQGPHDLKRFLDDACGADAALRSRVEELLKANRDAGAFLGGAAKREPTREEPIAESPGTIIGNYKLLEQIGEGGFGVVFMAEQTEPIRRKVAFKVLKPGMDTRQVIARFEAERQALALMDHPNIARVYDGGQTPSGRPYFVMELVRGIPITEYCDENQLPVRQRLELFISVCQAVQHAHQKGLIHRDLKPNNVLIASHDGAPVVKVIDFGIAKAITGPLTEKTLFTGFAQMIGTPLYMSPEQAGQSSLDVDTRSDIYSLGVLLYELLTGSTPFDSEVLKKAGYDEMRRIIREEEPPRPSTRYSTLGKLASTASTKRRSDPRRLSQLIRGELDWIAMKALEKDRNRRYETANAFAMDIQRYLADEPVAAGPPSVVYQARKFLRRNRGAVATAALVLVALVGGIIGTTWGMVEAREAEGRATKETGEKTKALKKAVADFDRAEKAERDMRDALNDREEALGIYGIALAGGEWEAGHPTRADHALEGCPASQRFWEWHHLKRLCNSDVRRLRFPDPRTWLGAAGCFSADGTLFAAPSSESPQASWKIWETQSGRPVVAFDNPRSGVMVIRSDNKAVAYAGSFGIAVHDLTGQEIVKLAKPLGYLAVNTLFTVAIAYSPDDKRILASRMIAFANNPGKVSAASLPPTIFDAATGQQVVQFDPGPNTMCARVAFSHDGSMAAFDCRDHGPMRTAQNGNRIVIGDSSTGKEIHALYGHTDEIRALAFSPKGKYLASGSADHTVKIWNVATGKEVFTLTGHEGTVNVVRFSPDGLILASGSADKTLRLWDVKTGLEILTQRGHDNEVHALAFRADGEQLTSAGAEAMLRTWNVKPSANPMDLAGRWDRIVFSPIGDRFVTTKLVKTAKLPWAAEIRIWDAATFKEILMRQYPSAQRCEAQFVDGRCLAILRSIAPEVIDVESEKSVRTLVKVSNVQSLSPDWRYAVVRGGTAGVQKPIVTAVNLYDAQSGKLAAKLGTVESGMQTFFHPDGRRLILSPTKGPPRILDVQDGRLLGELKGDSLERCAVAFSADGNFVAAGTDFINRPGDLRVWDLRTGELAAYLDGHVTGITSVAFNADGRRLASASKDKTVKIWDMRTSRELLTLRGHASAVQQVAFSPNGAYVVSVDASGIVKFWNGRPWQETPDRVIDAPGGPGVPRGQGLFSTKMRPRGENPKFGIGIPSMPP